MDQTLVYVKGKNEVRRACVRLFREQGQLRETDQSSTSATLGDGGMYSYVNDLAKWDEALEKTHAAQRRRDAPALTPVRLANGSEPLWPERRTTILAPGKPVAYGFGWFLDPYEGHSRMWHYGETMGFRTGFSVSQTTTSRSWCSAIALISIHNHWRKASQLSLFNQLRTSLRQRLRVA